MLLEVGQHIESEQVDLSPDGRPRDEPVTQG